MGESTCENMTHMSCPILSGTLLSSTSQTDYFMSPKRSLAIYLLNELSSIPFLNVDWCDDRVELLKRVDVIRSLMANPWPVQLAPSFYDEIFMDSVKSICYDVPTFTLLTQSLLLPLN